MAGASNAGWNFDNSYTRLPDVLFTRQAPEAVREPNIALLNTLLAEEMTLDAGQLREHPGWFTGNELPPGSDPIAQAYAGHQFGHFTMLGDGRAILLGEHVTADGQRLDVQLKGSGRTPYSRRGDGRAALGPMLREYLISEAMHALGIRTTRSLAVATTGETVRREEPLRGAVLMRIAASHIRVGTFEYVAARKDHETLKTLVDYTLKRHFPDVAQDGNAALSLLRAVAQAQAELISRWMAVGFIHGVMNTDNMALSGETIDYGPCAFMDAYSLDTVFSSIDHQGRYAYGRQPQIALWNVSRLAEALLPVLAEEPSRAVELAEGELQTFVDDYSTQWRMRVCEKTGLDADNEEHFVHAKKLLDWMQRNKADFTNTFNDLTQGTLGLCSDHAADPELNTWLENWKQMTEAMPGGVAGARKRMSAHNPVVIPRNHRVEEALTAVVEGDNWQPFNRLLEVLRQPYEKRPESEAYMQPGGAEQRNYQTFCGT